MHSNILMLELTNDYRVSPLALDDRLYEVAQAHAFWMARKSRMSHRGLEWSTPSDRVKKHGYSFRSVGENVATGQHDEEAVIDAWHKSPGHRRNMQNAAYTECGFGCAVDSRGRKYWCALYASPLT